MVEGKRVVLDCVSAQEHVPPINNDQFFRRHSGLGHIFAQLRNSPQTFQLTHSPISINQMIGDIIQIGAQFIENAVFYVLDGGI